MAIEPTTLVDDVTGRAPAAIRVLLDCGMRCMGCPIACIHTVGHACREHGADGASFLADLRDAAARAGAGEQTPP